ncbi:MAG: DUF4197 domain-containing protein [Flavobacteriales bacterium]|nr:DUF4197 domain-containing protein [Flavobacteriales bacterium]
MKRLLILPIFAITFYSCDLLGSLTNSDVVAGLKEALKVSTDTSVANLNRTDGYFANAAVKILLPPEAAAVESTLRAIPGIGNAVVDDVILKINRAAEQAAAEAKPIFINAITNITFNDAMNILNGPDDAATQYLKAQTYSQLVTAFTPPIENALTSVGAQQAWNAMITYYNTYNDILGLQDIPDNLAQYTTQKGLDGLFHIVAIEEGKIRNDVNHRVNELLQRVFGAQ